MPLDYHTLLKSEQELDQEKIVEFNSELDRKEGLLARNNWLAFQQTQKYLNEVEGQLIKLNDNLLISAQDSKLINENFRQLAVEVNTIRKILNLLKYGRYTDHQSELSS